MHLPLFIAHADTLLMLMLGGFALMVCVAVVVALIASGVSDTKEERARFELKDPPAEPPKLEERA
jgi:hypothetical protein